MNNLLSLIASLSLNAASFAANSICVIIFHELDIPEAASKLIKK